MPVTKIFHKILLVLVCLGLTKVAKATSEYTYKKGEYVIVRDGLAPNKQLSIAAHANGEGGYDNFHLYLMAEPAHEVMGALADISSSNILDTAADAYYASWSADSRHVAVAFRTDRHRLVNLIFSVTSSATEVSGPSLYQEVIGRKTAITDFETRTELVKLSWLDAKRFILKERRMLTSATPRILTAFGKFGRQAEEKSSPETYTVSFSAEAICELLPGNLYRIVDLKPGSFEE